jgi:hypothetical protein
MKNIKLGVMLAFLLNLAGCALAYKSSQVQKEIDKTTNSFNQSNAQADQAMAQVDGMMKSLYSTGAKKTEPPYAEMAKLAQELHQSHARLGKIRAHYDQVREPLQKTLASRGKITSREPEFKQVRSFPDQVKPIFASYEKEGRYFQSKIDAFQTVLRREKIVEVDVAELKKKIADGVAGANANIGGLRAQIQEFRQKGKGKNAATLDKLESDLNQIETEFKGVQDLEAKFRREVGENAKIVLGPHMASHTVVAQFEAYNQKIQNLSNHFNATAKDLK